MPNPDHRLNLELDGWQEFLQLRQSQIFPKPTEFINSDSLIKPRGIVLDLGERQVAPENTSELSLVYDANGSFRLMRNRKPTGEVTVHSKVIISDQSNVAVFATGNAAIPATATEIPNAVAVAVAEESW
ncbi:MAG: hypothetical protein V4489_04700 [Chlamydiota bacterium]